MRISPPLWVLFLIVFLGFVSASPIAEAEPQDVLVAIGNAGKTDFFLPMDAALHRRRHAAR